MQQMTHTFNKGTVALYSEPSVRAEHADEALYGQNCAILEEKDGFFKVYTDYGYQAFVPKEDLSEGIYETNYAIKKPFADLLPKPENCALTGIALPMGSLVFVDSSFEHERYAAVKTIDGETYYVHKMALTPKFSVTDDREKLATLSEEEKTALREKIAAVALGLMDTQYRWGGKTAAGIDCSGLCFLSYHMNGIHLYRDAVFDKCAVLKEITLSEAKKGDLLYFPGHVAMYLGNGDYVHSTSAFDGVCLNSFNPYSPIYREVLAKELLHVGTAF